MSALPSIEQPQLGRHSEAQAAADLYARHSGRIFGYCLGLLRNREEAEDAVQTTFLNAYRGLQRGVRPEFEVAWLFKIAQNVCRTRRETAWRRGRVEAVRDLDALQDTVAAPEHPTGQADALAQALRQLPERYQTVILLREWQGLSYKEIGERLELSEAAVEMLVFRARRSLAQQLEQVDEPRARALSVSSFVGFLKTLFGGAGLKTVVAAVAVTAAVATVSTESPKREKAPQQATPPAKLAPSPTVGTLRERSHSNPKRAFAPVGGDPRSKPPAARASAQGSESATRPAPTSGHAAPSSAHQPPGPSGQTLPTPPTAPPAVTVPSVSVPTTPAVTVPSVSVPGTPISTPAVAVPSVPLPPTPPLEVGTPDLPVSTPDLHLP